MMRVRLKADGRLVEILADGSERALPPAVATYKRQVAAPPIVPEAPGERDLAGYARQIRANVKLTQAEFASRIGVPIETVRNWEQGKRAPRGPARALLAVIAHAPDTVFAALAKS
jgi:putative transcriptional regulator